MRTSGFDLVGAGIASAVAIALVGFGAYLWAIAPPEADVGEGARVLPVPLEIPEFSLIDHRGRPFDRSRLERGWSLLYFGYTYCPDVCPATLQRLVAVQDLLAEVSPPIRVAFVSVDPERDSRERMASYVEHFHPDLLGVTGEADEIERLTRAVGAFHRQAETGGNGSGYLVDHSASLFLVDPSARLRAVLDDPHGTREFVDLLARVRSAAGDAAARPAAGLEVEGVWVREPPPGANAAAYMRILNPGGSALRVVGARTPAAERVELHRTVVEGGVARMTPVAAIEVPAGGEVELAPRGLHLMLIAPRALEEGSRVELTLELEGGATLAVNAPVRRQAREAHTPGHH